jgi:hypothetical protein
MGEVLLKPVQTAHKDQRENHVRVTLQSVNRLLKCIADVKSVNKIYSALLLNRAIPSRRKMSVAKHAQK